MRTCPPRRRPRKGIDRPLHWITFIILVWAAAAVQQSVVPFFAIHTIQPDLLVIIAVYYALGARVHDALLACWAIGLVIDLSSLSFHEAPNVGLHAFSLGLIGWLVVKVRDLTFRESGMTQLLFAFLVKASLSFLTAWYAWYSVGAAVSVRGLILTGLYSAAYTAILAPYGHWILRQMRTLLGITGSHRVRLH